MAIKSLALKSSYESKRLNKRIAYFDNLINELNSRELSADVMTAINAHIDLINVASGSEKELQKQMRKSLHKVLFILERQAKLVTKKHYQSRWLGLGMTAFGIPMGVAMGSAMDNMGLIGIGIPVGMSIGLAVGISMDKKAKDEGRQLNLESLF